MFDQAWHNWGPFLIGTAACVAIISFWVGESLRHEARLRRIPIRIHVNGIRGKSTIVRYIAAALRAGGIETVAKTTGSATRLIGPDGQERDIHRPGGPTILEQISILRNLPRLPHAIVFECMALNTDYQRASERRILKSTDGVVANVRIDHVEQLGDSIPEIAASLGNTAPRNAPLHTAETDPDALAALGAAAMHAGGRLVRHDPSSITEDEMSGFGPFDFPENVALALGVAMRHGVDRDVAIRAMQEARKDPGASRIHRHRGKGYDLGWVDLFGVNDVESARMNIVSVLDTAEDDTRIVYAINNRSDRPGRALQFSDMAADTERADRIVVMGDNVEAAISNIEQAGGTVPVAPLSLSEDSDVAGLARDLGGGRILLLGLANIHTDDADILRSLLEEEGA